MKKIVIIGLLFVSILASSCNKRIILTEESDCSQLSAMNWVVKPELDITGGIYSIKAVVDQDCEILWGVSSKDYFVFSGSYFEQELKYNQYFEGRGGIVINGDDTAKIDLSSIERGSDRFIYLCGIDKQNSRFTEVVVVSLPRIEVVSEPELYGVSINNNYIENNIVNRVVIKSGISNINKEGLDVICSILSENHLLSVSMVEDFETGLYFGIIDLPARFEAGVYRVIVNAVKGDISLSSEMNLNVAENKLFIENFEGFENGSASYTQGIFVGADGTVWSFDNCAGGSVGRIEGRTPYLAKGKLPAANIVSGIIPGVVNSLSFDYKQTHTSSVDLIFSIISTDGDKLWEEHFTTSGETGVIKRAEVNPIIENEYSGFRFRFEQANSSAGQVALDNLVWQ